MFQKFFRLRFFQSSKITSWISDIISEADTTEDLTDHTASSISKSLSLSPQIYLPLYVQNISPSYGLNRRDWYISPAGSQSSRKKTLNVNLHCLAARFKYEKGYRGKSNQNWEPKVIGCLLPPTLGEKPVSKVLPAFTWLSFVWLRARHLLLGSAITSNAIIHACALRVHSSINDLEQSRWPHYLSRETYAFDSISLFLWWVRFSQSALQL